MTTPRPGDAAMRTAVDVEAIRDRWAEWFGVTVYRQDLDLFSRSVGGSNSGHVGRFRLGNWAETFSHAPSDIQALLAEVTRLRAALEANRANL